MRIAPRLPFYDGRVADVLLTVPASMVAGRALQIEHLRRTSPDLARWERAHLFAGAGIVADSRPDAELAETELKLGALLPLVTG